MTGYYDPPPDPHDPMMIEPRGWPPRSRHSPSSTSHHQHDRHHHDRLTQVEIAVAGLEQSTRHREMVMRERGETIAALDKRIIKAFERIVKLEDGAATLKDQQQATSAKVEKLGELPGRLDAEKARMEMLITIAKYLGGGVLLIAASAGKVPWDHALKLLGK